MGGQVVDASIIAAPRQRITDEERVVVRDRGIPEVWAVTPAKLTQKNRDARWTLKRGRRKNGPNGKLMAEIATPMFGYKSNIGIDQHHGFIRHRYRAEGKDRLANIAFIFKRFLSGKADQAHHGIRTTRAHTRTRHRQRAKTSAIPHRLPNITRLTLVAR